MEDDTFTGAGAPTTLNEIPAIFLDWADLQGSSVRQRDVREARPADTKKSTANLASDLTLKPMQPPSDEGKRGHLAVGISIVEDKETYVFFFDDLYLSNSSERRTWEHKKFVTTAVVPKEKLQALNFSTEEMEGLGRTILGSLKAMYGAKK